jgi:hypothetical protein
MTDQERDDRNLQRYFAQACHEQLRLAASALARELLARGAPCALKAAEVSRSLALCHLPARAEPFARPR